MITPTRPEDWPIDPRFPGTNVPTPEALVAAVSESGIEISLNGGLWARIRPGRPACGCAAGGVYLLVPTELAGPLPETIDGRHEAGMEDVERRLKVRGSTLSRMSDGFEHNDPGGPAHAWGNEVRALLIAEVYRADGD